MSRAEARAAVRRPPLAVLVAVSALQPFALNVLAPATPGLARAFQTDYATIQLTLTFYLVAVAATQLVVGPISDRIGRRPCILAGIALFLAGSVVGAYASGIEALLLARVIQAMGGGACFALSRAVVRDTATKNEAASLIGYMTMAMVVAPMLAPIVGGFLDSHLGWRSIFGATVILAAGVAVAAAFLLSETAPLVGVASGIPLAAGFAALVRDRVFVGYTVGLSATSAAFFIFVAGAPFVVVEVMGRDSSEYGLYFVANAAGYMVGNFLSGRYGRRIGSERLAQRGVLVSVASVTLTLLLLALLPWTPALLFLPLSLNAVGNGMTIPGATASALSVRPELAGSAAGVIGASQLGLGALGTLLVGLWVPIWAPGLVVLMLICVLAGWAALRLAETGRHAASPAL